MVRGDVGTAAEKQADGAGFGFFLGKGKRRQLQKPRWILNDNNTASTTVILNRRRAEDDDLLYQLYGKILSLQKDYMKKTTAKETTTSQQITTSLKNDTMKENTSLPKDKATDVS